MRFLYKADLANSQNARSRETLEQQVGMHHAHAPFQKMAVSALFADTLVIAQMSGPPALSSLQQGTVIP